jgi:hypothetical protein
LASPASDSICGMIATFLFATEKSDSPSGTVSVTPGI